MHGSLLTNVTCMPAVAGLLFCLAIAMPGTARADQLSGREDPVLQAAIDTWLQDDDADSLPVLAALAADGNVAARLLLARIEVTDQGPGDYVDGLSRKERVELFRSTSGNGLFRPSWLKTEGQAGNRLASALLASGNTAVDLDAIRELYALGESEAAYDLVREVAGNGSAEQKQELVDFLPPESELMPYLEALQDPSAGVTPGYAALRLSTAGRAPAGPEADTGAAAYFVEYGYQTGVQTSEFDRDNAYYDGLAGWIESAPAMAPIANLCRRYCAADTRDCNLAVFGLVGGYYKAIRFDSPLQALIGQARFADSERAIGMVLRRVSFVRAAGASRDLLISDAELQARSACLAEAVATTRARRN